MSTFHVRENSALAAAAGQVSGSGMAAGSASIEASAASGPSHLIRHQHNQSMDVSTNRNEMVMSSADHVPAPNPKKVKKVMSADKLAELAITDPKRAKRIRANRQSAARSKERKMQRIGELAQKVQTLKAEATSLSDQLTRFERETNDMTAVNSELGVCIQTMEQQIHLQEALNDALEEEIGHLKVVTDQATPNSGFMMEFPAYGSGQQLYPNNPTMHTLMTAQQLQQFQINSQTQQQIQRRHYLNHLRQQQLIASTTSICQKDRNAADSSYLMKD